MSLAWIGAKSRPTCYGDRKNRSGLSTEQTAAYIEDAEMEALRKAAEEAELVEAAQKSDTSVEKVLVVG